MPVGTYVPIVVTWYGANNIFVFVGIPAHMAIDI